MLTNGDWTYAWNGENRLITAESATKKLEFAYDYKGRRIYKKVYTGTTGNWTLAAYKKFVYDNFVQIAEYDAMTSDTLKKSYLRGLDESLLNVNDNGTRYYYNIDGNKNVRSMIDGGGTVVAEYEYSPFGKLISRRGLYALENPFRFSSEYHDDETGLVYYNYRYYSTELGRWLSRDPINEKGGFNLYGMVDNNPVDYWDKDGLFSIVIMPSLDVTHSEITSRLILPPGFTGIAGLVFIGGSLATTRSPLLSGGLAISGSFLEILFFWSTVNDNVDCIKNTDAIDKKIDHSKEVHPATDEIIESEGRHLTPGTIRLIPKTKKKKKKKKGKLISC